MGWYVNTSYCVETFFLLFFYPTFFIPILFLAIPLLFTLLFLPTYILFLLPLFLSPLFLNPLYYFFFYDPHCFSFFFTSLEPLRHGPVHAAKKSQKVKIINYFLMVIFNVFLGKKTRRKAVHLCSKRSTAAQAVHRGGPVHAASTPRFFQDFRLIIFSFTTLR